MSTSEFGLPNEQRRQEILATSPVLSRFLDDSLLTSPHWLSDLESIIDPYIGMFDKRFDDWQTEVLNPLIATAAPQTFIQDNEQYQNAAEMLFFLAYDIGSIDGVGLFMRDIGQRLHIFTPNKFKREEMSSNPEQTAQFYATIIREGLSCRERLDPKK